MLFDRGNVLGWNAAGADGVDLDDHDDGFTFPFQLFSSSLLFFLLKK